MGRLRADIQARDRAVSRGATSHYLPTSEGRTCSNTVDCSSPFGSISPFFPASSLSNSASMNFIHSCLEVLPFLSVSIKASSSFTFLVAIAALSGCFGTDAFCAKEVCWSGPPPHMHTIRRVVARRLLCVMSKPPFLKVEPERQLAGAIPSVFGGLLRVQYSKCAWAAYIRCRRGIVCVVQDVREGRFEP